MYQIAEHFQSDYWLGMGLSDGGYPDDFAGLRHLANAIDIHPVIQDSPRGLGDAIRCAAAEIGDEPFALILPDVMIDSRIPATLQLLRCHDQNRGCVIATQPVDPALADKFGILVPEAFSSPHDRQFRIASLVEKPTPGSVRSEFGILGRYILPPEIFTCISRTVPGYNREIQLTDALALASEHVHLFACLVEGDHFDAGSKLGFLQASIAYALKDPDVAPGLRAYLDELAMVRAIESKAS